MLHWVASHPRPPEGVYLVAARTALTQLWEDAIFDLGYDHGVPPDCATPWRRASPGEVVEVMAGRAAALPGDYAEHRRAWEATGDPAELDAMVAAYRTALDTP